MRHDVPPRSLSAKPRSAAMAPRCCARPLSSKNPSGTVVTSRRAITRTTPSRAASALSRATSLVAPAVCGTASIATTSAAARASVASDGRHSTALRSPTDPFVVFTVEDTSARARALPCRGTRRACGGAAEREAWTEDEGRWGARGGSARGHGSSRPPVATWERRRHEGIRGQRRMVTAITAPTGSAQHDSRDGGNSFPPAHVYESVRSTSNKVQRRR